MKRTIISTDIFKGDTYMKKTLLVLALALVLVFSLTAIAGAKYAGYWRGGYHSGNDPDTPGYLSWGGAKKQMTDRGVTDPTALSTPHGGYASTTTKCVVCHSTHRAVGGGAAVGQVKNLFLTAGSDSCVQCHTTWGATPANLLVEWADSAAGPHQSSGGCGVCHKGGVHGTGTSKYWGFNAFLLGAAADSIADTEITYQDRTINGGTLLVSLDGSAGTSAQKWFWEGGTIPTTLGGIPSGLNAVQYGAQRSLLTGWTCSQTGCHVNSVFANTVWGQTYSRAATGSAVQSLMTGHSSVPAGNQNSGTNNSGCGPCHVGSYSAGYGLGSDGQTAASVGYGCDQCHDMIGKATNSTAFPHGNRNITIYEWDDPGYGSALTVANRTERVTAEGNIWMYALNQAAITETTSTGNRSALVDGDVKVVYGVGGATPGEVRDGVCLKCHVNIDAESTRLAAAAAGVSPVTNYSIKISGGHHNGAWTDAQVQAISASLADINPYTGNPGVSVRIGASYGNNLLYTWR
jgi:hypothetical protein